MHDVMKMLALGLTAFFLASPHRPPPTTALSEVEAEEPFVPAPQSFADEAACTAHLAAWVRGSARPTYDAAVGPYAIAPGDTRAHRVAARDRAHEIEEQRCLGAALSARRWTHSMAEVKPITIDDIRKMSFPAAK